MNPCPRPSVASELERERADAEFRLRVDRVGAAAVVRLAGELDLAGAHAVASALRSLEQPCDHVVLELSGLTFMDSTGIEVAVREHRRAQADGYDFVVAGARGDVLRVFELAGLNGALPLATDLETALAAIDAAAG